MIALNTNVPHIVNWNELKGKLKKRIEEVSDNDFLHVHGKEEVLIGRLQNKTGRKREEIIQIINEVQESIC